MAIVRENQHQNATNRYVTQRDLRFAPKKRKKADLLFLGALLILAGLVFFAAVSGIAIAKWVLGLWPLFALIIGVAAVMGYAVERKPRSPVGGMLMIFVGVIFGAARLHSDLNAIQIYGRYWLLLLIVFAAVELVRYYSHRKNEGAPPRLFSVGRVLFVLFLAGSGVLAGRVTTNDSVLASLKLPWFLNHLRDSVIGENYSFTDEPVTIADLKPNSRVTITNSYGDIKIIGGATTARATLTQGIRSWNREDAQKVADQLNIVITKSPEGEFNITTNRGEVNHPQFRTDLQIELPATVALAIVNSYGTVKANNLQNGLTVTSSYGGADVQDINGNAVFNLSYADVNALNIHGDVKVTSAKNVKINNVTGSVEVSGNNGSVDLRQVAGTVKVEAPYSRIVAQSLQEAATFKTQHGSVRVTQAADVTIDAPHSDVSASEINGDLRISSNYSDIKANKISGSLTVDAIQSNVSAEEIQSDVKITTTHGEVSVKNFHEGVQVKTSFEGVSLLTTGSIADDISVENSHGEIKLMLPQATNFKLDAESQNGQVNASGLVQIQQKDRSSLYAVSGGDGPTIKLRTSYRDIFVQANALRQIQMPGLVKPLTF